MLASQTFVPQIYRLVYAEKPSSVKCAGFASLHLKDCNGPAVRLGPQLLTSRPELVSVPARTH